MSIRMYDTQSKEVSHTNVTDIWFVGEKETYELTAGNYRLEGTHDHPILTRNGWVELSKLKDEDEILVVSNKQGKDVDNTKHRKIGGVWRTTWQREKRKELTAKQNSVCSLCNKEAKLEIHHIKEVHTHPELAFNEENVLAICKSCHREQHRTQGWQEGNPLTGSYVKVTSVIATGKVKKVYDLSVASKEHNFVANGIVVHNCFSRNAMSSRAIPIATMIQQVMNDPAMPVRFGANQPGMQDKGGNHDALINAGYTPQEWWQLAGSSAAKFAEGFSEVGYHKQIGNRLLEPFQRMKTVLTATEFENFWWLRIDKDADPTIFALAQAMKEAFDASIPEELQPGQWHTPYVYHSTKADSSFHGYYVVDDNDTPVDLTEQEALAISASCCAQVSYRRLNNSKDKALDIYEKLLSGNKVHASPFEHIATPMREEVDPNDVSTWEDGLTHFDRNGNFWSGNLKGWIQYRQQVPNNYVKG